MSATPPTVSSTSLGYRLVDCDNHYYEPYDAFTRYLEPEFIDRAIHIEPDPKGYGRVRYGSKRIEFIRVTPSDYHGAPGSLRDLFDGSVEAGYFQSDPIRPLDHPYMVDRVERLRRMDDQGVEAAMFFPTLEVAVENEMADDREALQHNLRAFNRWLEEDWGYNYLGRIFAAPVISLLDVDFATTELDRVLEAGAGVVYMKMGHLHGGGPGDLDKDPIWARLEEANVPVVIHACEPGYNESVSSLWGEKARPAFQAQSPFQRFLHHTRPTADTVAHMILGNVFGRFSKLKLLSVENGYQWVSDTLTLMDHAERMGRHVERPGGPLADLPSDVFKENCYISPFPEETAGPLADLIGVDHVIFGSDFPHSEGLLNPVDYAEQASEMDEIALRKIMRENTARLLKLGR